MTAHCECEQAGHCTRRDRVISPVHWLKCQAGHVQAIDDLYAQADSSHGNNGSVSKAVRSAMSVLKTDDLPCEYRGKKTGTVNCAPCRGGRKHLKYACELHGECTLAPAERIKACMSCDQIPDEVQNAAFKAAEERLKPRSKGRVKPVSAPRLTRRRHQRRLVIRAGALSTSAMGSEYAIVPEQTGQKIMTDDLHNLFDRVQCISMDRRSDRWERFVAAVDRCHWPFREPERFRAIDASIVQPPKCWTTNRGAWGCYRSHIRILEDALQDGVESLLVLEDDAEPVRNFGKRAKAFLSHVPDNWQMMFFGGQHADGSRKRLTKLNDEVVKCDFVTRTHCFALRQPFMLQFYRFLVDWGTLCENKTQHVDHAIARFMRNGNHAIYCPTHWLVAQAAGRSDIFEREENRRMFN